MPGYVEGWRLRARPTICATVDLMSLEQSRYQVRFDWGTSGLRAVGVDADVVVWVDAIAGDEVPRGVDGESLDTALIEATFASAGAAAQWVARLQRQLGRRIMIAVIAAGERREDGSERFAVEDQLAAGAVIDQLGRLGLDATSPEAASAEGAFLHLQRAVGHLMTASVTAHALDPKPTPGLFRLNEQLSADDVVVRREHPQARQ